LSLFCLVVASIKCLPLRYFLCVTIGLPGVEMERNRNSYDDQHHHIRYLREGYSITSTCRICWMYCHMCSMVFNLRRIKWYEKMELWCNFVLKVQDIYIVNLRWYVVNSFGNYCGNRIHVMRTVTGLKFRALHPVTFNSICWLSCVKNYMLSKSFNRVG
jgi:hypothetical protein